MNPKIYLYLIVLLVFSNANAQTIKVDGFITDEKTGESLIGVSVYNAAKSTGTSSNAYGYFSLVLNKPDTICFSYMGYSLLKQYVTNEKTIRVQLVSSAAELKQVVVKANVNRTQLNGTQEVDLKLLNRLPVMGGEKDVIKAIQFIPGVKKGADGTASMLVRGGAHDQNLILLDDAPVYNPTHLLGFFSLFNADVIKDAKLQIGAFDAKYGGRLSSVLDIHTIDGDHNKFRVQAATGILSSKAAIQGPMLKGKGSYLIAGRVSYIDQVFKLVNKELPFFFYDFNAKFNYELSPSDKIYLSFYNGDDYLNASAADSNNQVRLSSKMGNQITSLRWNHAFANKKMFSNITVFNSKYRYELLGDFEGNKVAVNSYVEDLGVRNNWEHYINPKLNLSYGFELIEHRFNPNETKLTGSFNDNIKEKAASLSSITESAIYFQSFYKVSNRIQLNTGIRASNGSSNLNMNFEPRLALAYQLNQYNGFHLSYTRMNQYMFLLTGGSVVLPTDLWFAAKGNIKPQQADQITLKHELKYERLKLQSELYYKQMKNLIEYKEGTTEFIINEVEKLITQGNGEAYGYDFSVNYNIGKFSFNGAYSLSWAKRKFSDLNRGEAFYARFDRRHDLNLIVGYEFNQRIGITGVWSYATGSRFTPIIGQFMMPNGNYNNIDVLPIYTGRNAVQLSPSHRFDFNVVIKNKPGKSFETEWHVGVYNAYNQTQPFRIKMIKADDGRISYKQTGLFGLIPHVSFQIKL